MLCIDGYYCIFYCLEGESVEDGSVMILCSFFDKDGYLIDVEDINDQVCYLVCLMLVLCLCDVCFMCCICNGMVLNVFNVEVIVCQFDFFVCELFLYL